MDKAPRGGVGAATGLAALGAALTTLVGDALHDEVRHLSLAMDGGRGAAAATGGGGGAYAAENGGSGGEPRKLAIVTAASVAATTAKGKATAAGSPAPAARL